MGRYNRQIVFVAKWIFIVSIATLVCFFGLIVYIYKGINFERDEKLFEGSRGFESTGFYAMENGEWTLVETSGTLNKSYYTLEEISPYVKNGFIAVEDKEYYSHKGINLKRTLLAAINYLTKRSRIFGASTITQQVVKNVSGDNELSLKRKLEEIIRAIHIERRYTKDEILEVYLNVIPMSDNIYGIGAAAKAYFGCEPSELSPEQAATLIGITNAPTAYSPYLNPDACKRKRNIVLSVMHSDGIVNYDEYESALIKPLEVIPKEKRTDRIDSWFVERVIDEVCADLEIGYQLSHSAARLLLLGGGYKVYTTMDRRAQSILESYFENKSNLPVEIDYGLNCAMVITNSENGNLAAIIGSVGKKEANRLLNHATIPHIPGSVLKPIALYAPLIDQGRINWATVFDDVPVSFAIENGEYREYPKNSPQIYDGLTTVKDGLCKSKNTLAVRLCNMMGADNVFRLLHEDFGINTLVEQDGGITDIATSPMALGQLSRGVSLLKLTECFSVFTQEGNLSEATSYYKVTDYSGKLLIEKNKSDKVLFKSTTARIMNQMLMTVVEDGTAKSISLKEKVDTAGKTGTSGGNKDKMFLGYTPYYTAGIWCGYDRYDKPIGALSKGHLAIWDEVMTLIHNDILLREGKREFSTEGLLYIPYCKDSGKEYSSKCIYDPRGDRLEYGYFSEDNLPDGKCDRHVLCYYDSLTKGIADIGCNYDDLTVVSLISVNDRAFPKEIIVTDAEFVYRDIDRYTERPIDYSLPYFYYTIPEGIFVGRSKGKKQFNSNCYIHSD